eukprot:UN30380
MKLLDRKFIQAIPKTEKDQTFRIVQFNMLAHGLTGIHTLSNPLKGFIKCPKEALQWNYRGPKILEEILRTDPDIICLQECDKFDWLNERLSDKYEGFHEDKVNSPCLNFTDTKDGNAMFWKKDVFQIQKTMAGHYKSQNQVYIVGELKHISTQKDVVVATTHLKATKKLVGEKIREAEVKELTSFLKNVYGRDKPIIITSDLNAD